MLLLKDKSTTACFSPLREEIKKKIIDFIKAKKKLIFLTLGAGIGGMIGLRLGKNNVV